MANASYIQTSFLAGEWSKSAQGRADLPAYRTAMARCLNTIPVETGAAVRRPGFRLLGQTRNGARAVVRPYTFSEDTAHTVEFTEGYARFYDGSTLVLDNTTGDAHEVITPYTEAQLDALRIVQLNDQFDSLGILLNGDVKPQILSVAAAPTDTTFAEFAIDPSDMQDGPYLDAITNSYVTPSALGGLITLTLSFAAYDSAKAYSIGDFVTDASISYRSLVAANQGHTPASSATYWEVVDATEAVNDGDGFGSGDIGRHVRLHSEPPLWSSATAYVANNPVTYNGAYYKALTASTNSQPGLDATKWAVDPSAHLWTWGKITSLSAGALSQISQTTGTAIGNMTGGGGLAAAFDSVTSQTQAACATSFNIVASGDYYLGKDYGASPKTVALARVYVSNSDGLSQNSNLPTAINVRGSNSLPASASNGTILGAYGAISSDFPNGVSFDVPCITVSAYRYVWLEIKTATDSFNKVAELQFFETSGVAGSSVQVQILGDALLYTSAVRTWRLGLYSDTTGWPRCGVGHEGRLWLSGAMDNRIDASRSNKPFTFSPTETDGSVTGSCGISYVFNAKDRNEIFWMESQQHGILCGTQGGEWMVQATQQSDPLTPATIQAHRRTFIKCANTEPARTKNTLVIVQELRRRLVEYFPEVNSGQFCAPDLSWGAKHLTKASGLKQIVFQQETAPIVWAITQAGALLGMTYQRDSLISSKEADMKGWHRHTHGAGRTFSSICVGPSDDDLETLVAVTYDSTDELYRVEMLQPIVSEDIDLLTGWYLDGAIRPSSYDVEPTAITLSGLDDLEGQTVTVFMGGLDLGTYAVASGAITVTIADVAGLTLEYALSLGNAASVLVGHKYTSQGQILRPIDPREAGAQNGPGFGKTNRAHQVAAMLDSAKGLKFGIDFDNLKTAQLSTKGGTRLGDTDLFSGVHHDTLDGTYGLDTMLCWQFEGPFPGTMIILGGFLYTADR